MFRSVRKPRGRHSRAVDILGASAFVEVSRILEVMWPFMTPAFCPPETNVISYLDMISVSNYGYSLKYLPSIGLYSESSAIHSTTYKMPSSELLKNSEDSLEISKTALLIGNHSSSFY